MNSLTLSEQPQEIDYQNLERFLGQDIQQIPAPVQEIIARVLRKVREDSPHRKPSDYLHCPYPLSCTLTQFPMI